MAPAMALQDNARKARMGETRSKTDDFKSKFACILEASEATRMRMGRISTKNIMRTLLQEEETIHYNITIEYTNLFLWLKQ